MKKLLKLTLCLMALLPLGAWADVENKATATWLFNQYGKGETVASTSATQVAPHRTTPLPSVRKDSSDGKKRRTMSLWVCPSIIFGKTK